MTVSVVHADTGSRRQGWHILLWLAPLTALWIVLIYWQPIIQTSGTRTRFDRTPPEQRIS